MVQFEDNAPGIPHEVQARVFQPFFTTKPPGKGNGLGLDTSYRIVVNDHMGTMAVSSEPARTNLHRAAPGSPARDDVAGVPTQPTAKAAKSNSPPAR